MSNTDTKNYTDTTKISAKDIELLLISISDRTARLYLREIKDHFQIRIVLFTHFKQYFKII